MSKRVSAIARVRAQIDELFSSERELGRVLEEVAGLGVRLLMQDETGASRKPRQRARTTWSATLGWHVRLRSGSAALSVGQYACSNLPVPNLLAKRVLPVASGTGQLGFLFWQPGVEVRERTSDIRRGHAM